MYFEALLVSYIFDILRFLSIVVALFNNIVWCVEQYISISIYTAIVITTINLVFDILYILQIDLLL